MENKKDEDIELDTTKRFEKLQSVFNYSIFPQKEESPQEKTDIEENQEESTDIMIEESTPEEEKEDSIDKSLEEIQDEKDRKGIEESPNVEDENQAEEIVQEKENSDCIDEAKEDTKMEEILDSNIITPSTPKYNGYKETIIRYSIFAILSLTFLLISFLGYNSVKRKKTSLIENSTINYSVCLNENHFYETECVGEEKKYISSLTNKIKIDYVYNGVYQKREKKNYEYYIKSRILFFAGNKKENESFKKEDLVTEKKKNTLNGKNITITESIEIPFQDYNDYAQNYKNEFPMATNSDLEVSLIIKEGKTERELSTIIIPLTKITYNITKKEVSNKVTEYNTSPNIVLIIVFVIGIVIGLIFTILTIEKIGLLLWNTRPKKTLYQKRLSHILKKYDKYIVTLENQNTIMNKKEEYIVKTFLELLDVRNIIKEPILYYKVNDIKSEFYIQDTEKLYKFIMEESDFEEK